MVAMRRMLERIIIQVSNTSNGSSFNLVSTYLQIMSSGCPRYHKWWGTVRASHFGPITRLSSHRRSVGSQCLVGSMPLPCQPLGLNFSDGRQRHPLCAHLLYRSMYIPLNVCQAQHGGSKTASQEYTVYNPIWKENMGLKKTHSPGSLNRKTMADGGRTTHEHPFPWEEAFPRKETMEYLLS